MLKSTAQTARSSFVDNAPNVKWVTGVVSKIRISNKKFGYCLIQPDDGSGSVLLHKKTLDEYRPGSTLAIDQRLRFKPVALKEVEIPGVDRFAIKLELLRPLLKRCSRYNGMTEVFVAKYDCEQGLGHFEDAAGNTYHFRIKHLQQCLGLKAKTVHVGQVFHIGCSSKSKLGPRIDKIRN